MTGWLFGGEYSFYISRSFPVCSQSKFTLSLGLTLSLMTRGKKSIGCCKLQIINNCKLAINDVCEYRVTVVERIKYLSYKNKYFDVSEFFSCRGGELGQGKKKV